MAGKFPDVGEVRFMEMALKDASPEALTLKLYVNDKTPADGDVASSYTEMSTHGYAAKSLARSGWTVATVSGEAKATQAKQTWTFSDATAVTVYGFFYVGATSGTLVHAERFGNPYIVSGTTTPISVLPRLGGKTQA